MGMTSVHLLIAMKKVFLLASFAAPEMVNQSGKDSTSRERLSRTEFIASRSNLTYVH